MRFKDRNSKSSKAGNSPYVTARLHEMENPFSHVPKEKWEELREQIGSEVEKKHNSLLTRFDSLVHACNPLQALGHFAFFDRFLNEIQSGKEYRPLSQPSLEFFQAYFLTIPITELHVKITPIPILLELNDVLRALETTFPMLGVGKTREKATDIRARQDLGQQVRVHTFGVRNSGYFQQVMTQLRALFVRLDEELKNSHGVTFSGLITMNEGFITLIQARLRNQIEVSFKVTQRKKTATAIILAYCEAKELPATIRDEMLAQCHSGNLCVEDARAMCVNHAALYLTQLYGLSVTDFVEAYPEPIAPAILLRILEAWSLPPEGLLASDRTHIFLNNPIWHRPILRIGPELFMWPMVEMFHSFGLEMLESLIRPNAKLWKRYQDRVRASFLEDRVFELCQSAFPNADIFRGSLWLSNEKTVEGENDILVVVDDIALTIECKSGRISPEARRGLPERLRKEVKKLIEDASKQSEKFSDFLIRSNEVLQMPTKRGATNVIDATKIKRAVRINITLDFFGPLACAVRQLVDAKLIDPAVETAPTLALVDFENVLHILPSPLERLHYFSRRAAVERCISLMSDEEDLLACYLAIGLNFGTMEEQLKDRLNLSMMGESIQPYLIAYYAGRAAIKPRRRFTHWWQQILERLQTAPFRHWTRAGFICLDVRHEDQIKFHQAVKRLIKEVKHRWHDPEHKNQVVASNGPSHRKTAIAAVILKRATRESRNDEMGKALQNAIDTANTSEVVALYFDAAKPAWPYNCLAVGDPDRA